MIKSKYYPNLDKIEEVSSVIEQASSQFNVAIPIHVSKFILALSLFFFNRNHSEKISAFQKIKSQAVDFPSYKEMQRVREKVEFKQERERSDPSDHRDHHNRRHQVDNFEYSLVRRKLLDQCVEKLSEKRTANYLSRKEEGDKRMMEVEQAKKQEDEEKTSEIKARIWKKIGNIEKMIDKIEVDNKNIDYSYQDHDYSEKNKLRGSDLNFDDISSIKSIKSTERYQQPPNKFATAKDILVMDDNNYKSYGKRYPVQENVEKSKSPSQKQLTVTEKTTVEGEDKKKKKIRIVGEIPYVASSCGCFFK